MQPEGWRDQGGKNEATMEPSIATACLGSRCDHHPRRIRRLDSLDDLRLIHRKSPSAGLRDRLVGPLPPISAALSRHGLAHFAFQPDHSGDWKHSCNHLRLHSRGNDRAGAARRRRLPDCFSLSAGHITDRHRRRLALDSQSATRPGKFPASDRPDGHQPQLAGKRRHRDLCDHPGIDLAKLRLLHGADAGGPEGDQHGNMECCPARWREPMEGLSRNHHPDDEVHLPDLRHPAVARCHQGL